MTLLSQIAARAARRDVAAALVEGGARPDRLACDLAEVTIEELATLPRRMHVAVAAAGTDPATLAQLAGGSGAHAATAAARPACPTAARLAHLQRWVDDTHGREGREAIIPVVAALARDDANAVAELIAAAWHAQAPLARALVDGLDDDPDTLAGVWHALAGAGPDGQSALTALDRAAVSHPLPAATAVGLLEAGVYSRDVARLAATVDVPAGTRLDPDDRRDVTDRVLALAAAGVLPGPIVACGRLPLAPGQVTGLLTADEVDGLCLLVRSAADIVGADSPAHQLGWLLAAVDQLRARGALDPGTAATALDGVTVLCDRWVALMRLSDPVRQSLRGLLVEHLAGATTPATRTAAAAAEAACAAVTTVVDLEDAAGLLAAAAAAVQGDPAALADDHIRPLADRAARHRLPAAHPVLDHLVGLLADPAVFGAVNERGAATGQHALAVALVRACPAHARTPRRVELLAGLVAADLDRQRLPVAAVATLLRLLEDGWDGSYDGLAATATALTRQPST